ncbi:MAG: glycosyltransferase family 2 protein [Thermotogae bacterium]|nr:glycosyltransferase family 2 protein [Thermotogota bacterium]
MILTKNEESNLPRLLESLKLLNCPHEIVVMDSGSTDSTLQIAKSFGARTYVREWSGYVAQREWAISLARGEWILFLDADEWLTPELASEICQAIMKDKFAGYIIARRNEYLGRMQRMKPTSLLRLARKGSVRVMGRYVHEYLSVDGHVGRLKGYIGHRPYRSLTHHWEKNGYYAYLSAREKFEDGRRVSFLDLILRPALMFLRYYLLQWAFLDGFRGLIYAFSQAWYHFQKYALLYEMRANEDHTV